MGDSRASQAEPLKIRKQAVAVELTLTGEAPRSMEVFLAEHRANECRSRPSPAAEESLIFILR